MSTLLADALSKAAAARTVPLLEPFVWVESKKMGLIEWLLIPDNPFQRDTEKRAKNARHLSVFDDSHRRVTIAVMPNGQTYKVDGHTRAFMWSRSKSENLPANLMLNVDVYKCRGRDKESLGALYDRFDSPLAVERPQDRLFGAAREVGMEFRSPMMRAFRFGAPIKMLYQLIHGYGDSSKGFSDSTFTYKAIDYFKRELQMFDACAPKHMDYIGPIIMGATVTFMRHGEEAGEFWTKYNHNAGRKDERSVDGVEAVRHLLAELRQKRRTTNQWATETLGRVINSFEMYREGDVYRGKNGVARLKRADQITQYLEDARIKKGAR